MNKITKILWGLVLIALGTTIALKAFGVIDINIFFDGWWTLFIIVPCFISLFSGDKESIIGDLIGIGIGVVLLLACQGILDFGMTWKLIFPAILVVCGVVMIVKVLKGGKIGNRMEEIKAEGGEKRAYVAAFSGQKVDFSGETFEGCSAEATFGGIELNLTKAKIKKDVVITTNAIFGGIDVLVPNDVNVKVSSTSICGGVKNSSTLVDGKVTVYINATCMFGGVSIK